ncbi:MAG TPA: hypothetical protein VGC57_05400 [Cellulomonas sp.]
MVPDSFTSYFTGSATAAGSLIGLLFVAIALRPESVFGPKATLSGQSLAGSAFTALVNAFFVSLIALIPGENIGTGVIVLAGLSLLSTVRLHRKLRGKSGHLWLAFLSVAAFGLQAVVGVQLLFANHTRGLVADLAYIIIAGFAVALGRAWALVQGEHLRDSA